MFRWLTVGLLLIAGTAFVACGNDDDVAPTPTPLPTAMNDARTVSDEEYLAIICTGVEEFSSALITANTVEEITGVVEDYIASLQEVQPAADVRPFHERFIAYLSESLDEPTQLVNRPRPLPEEDVRERLADLEDDVEECRDLVFFSERREDLTR